MISSYTLILPTLQLHKHNIPCIFYTLKYDEISNLTVFIRFNDNSVVAYFLGHPVELNNSTQEISYADRQPNNYWPTINR